MKKTHNLISLILCMVLVSLSCFQVRAALDQEQRTVRVGFFSAEGYHILDENGTKSGYGYDFLQLLLRYNDWNYEYVGYDKNWPDMLGMLDDGQIDMVTLVNKTPEREEKYSFSEQPIGISSTIISVSSRNAEIISGEYDTYQGAVVGLVKNSIHNEHFEQYAAECGFSYSAVYYESVSDLLADLRSNNGKIDMAVTSNMRILQDEVVLDDFNAQNYYAVTRKEDQELMREIDKGISQLNVYSQSWQSDLYAKYYSNVNSRVIALSAEEREYLKELRENGQVLNAVINPELNPYAYFENGEAKGIVVSIFQEIALRLNLDYKIIEAANRWQYQELLNSGEAVIDLTAFMDYSYAQLFDVNQTDSYLDSMMSMLFRKDSNLNQDGMTIAVVKDPIEYIGYSSEFINQYNYREYDSIEQCIAAVKKGEADATFLYVYMSEYAVASDYKNKLQYTIMPDYAFSLGIGVTKKADHRLLSILNKGVNSLTDDFKQGVMLEESSHIEGSRSIRAIAYDYPIIFVLIAVLFSCIVFMVIIMLLHSNHQKLQLSASQEMQRFIGYVCESYDMVVEINLKARKRTAYKIIDGDLQVQYQKYIDLNEEYFSNRVKQEDRDRIVEAFSEESIEHMIQHGGDQTYLECQILESDGSYQWYSYIIKAVPADEKHPKNFIVFKKNINAVKMEEEQQKKLLEDALALAKSANLAKGQFLSRMSHEIRTPLNAVIGYMDIARDSEDNPTKVMHCVENSQMAAKHLLNIINDVLDISSIESGKMKIAHQEFDLKTQLTSITTIFFHQCKEKNVRFEVLINELTEEWVIGDSLRLNQILMNLLSNAVKFTPEQGLITLTVNQLHVDDNKIHLTFCIRDTGVGMSDEYMKKLFTPFEQESAMTAQKYGGSGLGLSITYNLVQMMGGSIEVESVQNEGTSFLVSLTFDCSDNLHEEQLEIEQQDYSKIRALILADYEDGCLNMKQLFKRWGVKSDVVHEGTLAIKKLKSRLGGDYMYNLCIIDLDMPNQNGLEITASIMKACGTNSPVIIAAAYDVTEYIEEAVRLGIKKVIAKPLFESTMVDILVSSYGKYRPNKEEIKSLDKMKGLRVLLCEDNPMNMEIAVEILQKAGMLVESVTDGKQAVDTFTACKPGTYDVILMDVQMPVMDGYEATIAIRKSMHPDAQSIPIIAMTANAFAEDVNEALVSGMNGHISKPVNYEKLYDLLNQFCRLN